MSNTPFSLTVSAPGSIMIMGEHAVVKGYKAIACAVDKRINVTLTGRDDRRVLIRSGLGNYAADLDNLVADKNLSFVLKAIELQKQSLSNGFELDIQAQFSHTLGLGSSGAVTVATIKALACFTQQELTKEQHLRMSLAVVHAVQQRGSGSDLAASIYGGVIAYQIEQYCGSASPVEQLPILPEVALYYAGYKTTTAQVLSIVASKEAVFKEQYQMIYQTMGNITQQSISMAKAAAWQEFGLLMDMYQGQMDSLGVNDAALSDIVYKLRGHCLNNKLEGRAAEGALGVKISGSGLGDCVVVLGKSQIALQDYQKIDISIADRGVIVHE